MNSAMVDGCRSVVSTCALTFLLVEIAPPAWASGPDFNGDGRADLVIGAPMDAVGTRATAGSVAVTYGSSSSVLFTGSQWWTQNTPGIAGVSQPGDQFGQSTAFGDFDGDGFDDLAIGVPFEDLAGRQDAGAVHVIHGSASGLTSQGSQFWHQNKNGMHDKCEKSDLFGWTLTSGDFNGDGYSDLAIAVPYENTPQADGGMVQVLYGTANGLRVAGTQRINRNKVGGNNIVAAHFGYAMSSGDFNGDGFDELVIGAPGSNLGSGEVFVVPGDAVGLLVGEAEVYAEGLNGVPGLPAIAESFGFSLSVGDLNGDSFDDLVVGIPFDGWHDGAVCIIPGSDSGLAPFASTRLKPADLGDPSSSTTQFGWATCVGDFNGDGYGDLLVSDPYRTVDSRDNAGRAYVVRGSAGGVDPITTVMLDQIILFSGGPPDEAECLGWSMRQGDYNGDGFADAAISVPFEDNISPDSGMVIVLPGGPIDFDYYKEWSVTQELIGLGNTSATNEAFGFGRGP